MTLSAIQMAAYLQLGHYQDAFDPTVPLEARGPMLAEKLREELEQRQATIVYRNGIPTIVQSADEDLLVLELGQPLDIKLLTDKVMGVTDKASNQPVAEENISPQQRKFKEQLAESFRGQGIEHTPSTSPALSDRELHLQPFRKALAAAIADQQKNLST